MDKITDELIAENLAISKELQSAKAELCKLKDEEIAYAFQVVKLSERGAIVRGILLAEGVWKNKWFSYEKMKEYAHKFIGAVIMKDHGLDKEFGKLVGGKITKIVPDDTLRALAFEAEVTHPSFIELLKNRLVGAISPKGLWKIDDSKAIGEVVDCSVAIEASLTATPACDLCNIFSVQLSNYKEMLDTHFEDEADNITNCSEYVETPIEMTAEYIDKLPNSSFAYIDKSGRYLPYKNAKGIVNIPLVKISIAKLDTIKMPDIVKATIKAKLERILKRS